MRSISKINEDIKLIFTELNIEPPIGEEAFYNELEVIEVNPDPNYQTAASMLHELADEYDAAVAEEEKRKQAENLEWSFVQFISQRNIDLINEKDRLKATAQFVKAYGQIALPSWQVNDIWQSAVMKVANP